MKDFLQHVGFIFVSLFLSATFITGGFVNLDYPELIDFTFIIFVGSVQVVIFIHVLAKAVDKFYYQAN